MLDIVRGLYFNTFFFSAVISLLLNDFNWQKTMLVWLFLLPIIFGYPYELAFVVILQLVSWIFLRKNKHLHLMTLNLYVNLAVAPVIEEIMSVLIQTISYKIFHVSLGTLATDLILFVPDILILYLLHRFFDKNHYQVSNVIDNISNNDSLLRFLNWIVWSLVLITYSLWTVMTYFTAKAEMFFSLMLLIVVITLVVIVNLYEVILQNERFNQASVNQAQFEQIQKYTIRLEDSNMSLRRARHDYKNTLLSLNGYFLDNDLDGAKKYLSKLVDENNKQQEINQTLTLELANLKVKELKYLFVVKLQKAQEEGTNVKVEINKEITEFPVNIVPLIRCSGIFLDNALEATRGQKNPQIQVLLTKYSNDYYSLIFKNSIEQEVNVREIFLPGKTNKKKHQGLGLANVRQIIDDNPNLSLEVDQEDGMISFEIDMQRAEEN